MFAIRETSVNVHGESVKTFTRVVCEEHVSVLVDAGSNGLFGEEGCDSPGRSYVGLLCDSPYVFFDPLWDRKGKIVGVQISGCGDSVLEALVDSLEFAVSALKDARSGMSD